MDIRKDVTFTLHAEDKLNRLTKLGVTKESEIGVVKHPGKVISGYYGRKIAQGYLKEDLILRIVYSMKNVSRKLPWSRCIQVNGGDMNDGEV